jgi:predicted nuclease of predicted toxin-antitoxin system
MKFLADENFPRQAVRTLRENGFSVTSVAEDSAGSTDEDILARCATQELTLLTLDKDFGELVFRKGCLPIVESSCFGTMPNPLRSLPKLLSSHFDPERTGSGVSASSVGIASG